MVADEWSVQVSGREGEAFRFTNETGRDLRVLIYGRPLPRTENLGSFIKGKIHAWRSQDGRDAQCAVLVVGETDPLADRRISLVLSRDHLRQVRAEQLLARLVDALVGNDFMDDGTGRGCRCPGCGREQAVDTIDNFVHERDCPVRSALCFVARMDGLKWVRPSHAGFRDRKGGKS